MMLRIGSKFGFRFSALGSRRDLKTEHRAPKSGFTLIEVMVAVAVLSFGIVMLYQSFFICADSSHYASNLLFAKLWMDGKIGQEKEAFVVSPSVAAGEEEGVLALGARQFSWKKTLQPIEAGLYSLTVALFWKETGRQRSLSYSTYLIS